MSEKRPLLTRVPAPFVLACVWALSTLYMFVAQSQRIGRPWGVVAARLPQFAMHVREQAVLCFAAVLALFACRLLARRPLWSMTALVLSAVVLNYDIHSSNIAPDQYLPVCVAVYFVGAAAGSRRTALTAAGLALTGLFGYVLACLARGLTVDTPVEAIVLLIIVLAWVLGNSQRRERLHAEELRTQAAEQAVTAERLRIARELHDMVAHSVGVVALQAGAAKLVVHKHPERAQNAFGVIEDVSRETLAGLRRMLGALHDADAASDTPPAGLAAIDRLVANARNAGVRVDVEWRGARRPLPPEIDLSVFRIVQESVTNVMKHSGARQCRVSVDFHKTDLNVVIVDSGTRRSSGGTGYGLAGMRDRVELLHGEFSSGPRPEGGFRVAARIPVPLEV